MAPTIVLRDGKPFIATGSPGGSTIITTVLQILIDRLDLGMTLPQAIADPRLTQRNTTTTQAEPAFLATPERTALRRAGHVFARIREIGAATGIEFLDGGRLLAAAEPVRRGGGSAMVVAPEAGSGGRLSGPVGQVVLPGRFEDLLGRPRHLRADPHQRELSRGTCFRRSCSPTSA